MCKLLSAFQSLARHHPAAAGVPGGVTMNSSRLKRAYDMMVMNKMNEPAEEVRMAAMKLLCTTQQYIRVCGGALGLPLLAATRRM